MAMRFEWDDAKAAANHAKHGVPFELAMRMFDDPFRLEIEDSRVDYGEERIITLGLIDGRVYVVIFTPREDRCRIISARKANARESRRYHELQT
jgi:uncharacterized DUF497 family protein